MPKTSLRILTVICLTFFIAAILQILFSWSSLPDEVPTHYNALGEADAWGNKWFIFFPPLLGLAMWLFMGAVKNPTYINLPGFHEGANERQVENAHLMLQILRSELFILLCCMSFKDVYVAKGGTFSLGYWEMIIFIGVVIVTIVFFTIRNAKLKTN